mmetsp:Transcript_17232/g.29019  ORF Transcript_17232/g.29019 Transcript_17232/m.29019 type:complete len:162 (-) Transcript_17232:1341-1826(-)
MFPKQSKELEGDFDQQQFPNAMPSALNDDNQYLNYQSQRVTDNQKERLEQVFIGILYAHFKSDPKREKYLREQFEAQNIDLYAILEQYDQTHNVDDMKQQMVRFIEKGLGPEVFQNLRDAINGLYNNGFFGEDERDLLRQLSLSTDKHLMATWDTYVITQD